MVSFSVNLLHFNRCFSLLCSCLCLCEALSHVWHLQVIEEEPEVLEEELPAAEEEAEEEVCVFSVPHYTTLE